MSWDAPVSRASAIEAAILADFDALVAQVASEHPLPSHVAPPPAIAEDSATVTAKAIYTAEGTRYMFPCAEVYAGRGDILDGGESTDGLADVFVTFQGTTEQLSAWAPVYLTALVRLFMQTEPPDGLWWPESFDTSPIGHDAAEGTYVRSVYCGVRYRTV